MLLAAAVRPAWGQAAGAADVSLMATAVVAVAGAAVVSMIALGLALYAWIAPRRRTGELERRVAVLQDSLAALTAVLDAAPDGRFERAESGLETCSPGLARLLDAPPMAIGSLRDLADHFSNDDFAALSAAIDELRRSGATFDIALRSRKGRTLHGRGRAVASGRAPRACIVWFQDITRFRDASDALAAELAAARREGARFREMLDSVPFPVWQRRADLSLGWANHAYCRAVERDLDTVLRDGVELAAGVGPRQSRALAEMAQQTREPQRARRAVELGDTRRTFEITETPLAGNGTAGLAIDVTHRDASAHAREPARA